MMNMCKMRHGAQRSWTHLLCVCFCVCGRQNPYTPNLSPMADDAITQGGIQGLESPLYISMCVPVLVCVYIYTLYY